MAACEPVAAALFDALEHLAERPRPFERTTVRELWADPHVSERMLAFHLDERVDVASYRGAFIAASVAWIDERFGLARGVRVLDAGCGPGLYATRSSKRKRCGAAMATSAKSGCVGSSRRLRSCGTSTLGTRTS